MKYPVIENLPLFGFAISKPSLYTIFRITTDCMTDAEKNGYQNAQVEDTAQGLL